MSQPSTVPRAFHAATIARMGLLLVALAFLVVMAGRAASVAVLRAGWFNPLIAVEPAELDLGVVSPNTVQTCRFVVRNAGQQPLTITHIRIGCSSCMQVVQAPDRPLAPHSTDALVTEFRTHGLAGPTVRTLAVESNDPTRPSLVVRIKADVRADNTGADQIAPP